MSRIDTLKRYYHYYGMKMLLLKLFRNHSAENFDYDSWLEKNAITEAELEKQKKYEKNNIFINFNFNCAPFGCHLFRNRSTR